MEWIYRPIKYICLFLCLCLVLSNNISSVSAKGFSVFVSRVFTLHLKAPCNNISLSLSQKKTTNSSSNSYNWDIYKLIIFHLFLNNKFSQMKHKMKGKRITQK